jgi:hypothetical protein
MAPLLLPGRRNDQCRKCAAGQLIRLPGTGLPVNAVASRPPQAQPPPRRSRQVREPGGSAARPAGPTRPDFRSPSRQGRDLPRQAPVAAAVTLPKDLLLTDRVVIITLCHHQRLVAGFRSAACPITERSRSGLYAITCDVITWQWIAKVRHPFRLRTGQNANLLDLL